MRGKRKKEVCLWTSLLLYHRSLKCALVTGLTSYQFSPSDKWNIELFVFHVGNITNEQSTCRNPYFFSHFLQGPIQIIDCLKHNIAAALLASQLKAICTVSHLSNTFSILWHFSKLVLEDTIFESLYGFVSASSCEF